MPRSTGTDVARDYSWPVRRTVLAVAHNAPAADRLLGLLPELLGSDPAVQVVYTVPPGNRFEGSARSLLSDAGVREVPWSEAVHQPFDLGVAANHGGLEQVRAPVLVVPHGVGPTKLVAQADGFGPRARRPVTGAVAGVLVRFGRVVPASVGVAHVAHRQAIVAEVPDAESVVEVMGDPCVDAMARSRDHRDLYRSALGVTEGQKLAVVSTTWGSHSLIATWPELFSQLPRALAPHGYRVVAILHPGVWSIHGKRQVEAWLDEARRYGLRILAPESAWQSALIASNIVITDHGSLSLYGASAAPTALAHFPETEVAPGSHLAQFAQWAPRLRRDLDIPAQIDEIISGWTPACSAHVAASLTSEPGRSHALLRARIYQLMDLPEPESPPVIAALPEPHLLPALQPPVHPAQSTRAGEWRA